MMKADIEPTTLYLIGFRITPDSSDPQLYTIYINDDRPILVEGRPVLFTQPALAPAALRRSDCGASPFGPAPSEIYRTFDVADALCTLKERPEERSDELLNLINVLLEFVNAIADPMPAAYRRSLETLADHLTFDNSLDEFLKLSQLDRQTIADAVYWSLGAITSNSRILAS